MMKNDKVIQSTPFESQKSFGTMLKNAIQDVNVKQTESDKMTEKLILGEDVDLHNVMITAQKASIALNATVEVRNKVIEAYQEIIRMPV
ncbi:flagellar hook-basal body complex protein FliE [Sporosarcina sp. UB5]